MPEYTAKIERTETHELVVKIIADSPEQAEELIYEAETAGDYDPVLSDTVKWKYVTGQVDGVYVEN